MLCKCINFFDGYLYCIEKYFSDKRFQCLQSLESIKLVKKSDFRGRVVTPAGQRDMDRVAAMIAAPAAVAAAPVDEE